MLHVAAKAFWPAPLPFPVMHVDTGHNFDAVIEFRDRTVERLGLRLVVASVEEDIAAGRVFDETGPRASRNRLQTHSLLRGIRENKFDAVFGGARRDEEKARAKERVFSFRDEFGQWDPKAQRPELWNLYNGRHRRGEHIRVPAVELDRTRHLAVHTRGGDRAAVDLLRAPPPGRRTGRNAVGAHRFLTLLPGEEPRDELVRFRTVGDATCTGCVESSAATAAEVVTEVAASRITERGATRADDRISEAGMEDRKKEGYF